MRRNWAMGMAIALVLLGVAPVWGVTSWIVGFEGMVEVKKKDDSQFRPATVGMGLQLGDRLRLGEEATLWVRCDDGEVRRGRSAMMQGLRVICPNTRLSDDSRNDALFLLLLTGRAVFGTQVLEERPLLRWEAIPDALAYRVRVWQQDEAIWETEALKTEVRYGGAPLQEGEEYRLVVEAIALRGRETVYETVYELELGRLAESQRLVVREKIAEIEELALGEVGKALISATLYREVGVSKTGEEENKAGALLAAMEVLEGLADKGEQTPAVHRFLGEVYLELGWLTLARERYEVALANSAGNVRELAEIREGLVLALVGLGEFNAAREQLQLAQEGFLAVEDEARSDLLAQWLEKLEGFLETSPQN